ncbi:MAG: ABC transporter ATP-binding protein [Candidatus Bipolaricaulaceae bacterium]
MSTLSSPRLLEVRRLTKIYTSGFLKTTRVVGCQDVSFNVERGEIVALLGESGSGKTTVANLILRIFRPTSGEIFLEGKDIFSYPPRLYYGKVQQIFQDPYAAFNYFYRIDRVLHRALTFKKRLPFAERKERILEVLDILGLNAAEVLGRYPHQLSGGQLQRLLIARALLIEPDLVVADEPTSMIDASSRAGILNHLFDLKDRGIAILFITHDVGQAAYIADRAVVMHKGRVVEQGQASTVLFSPTHPYVQKLLADVPKLREKWDFSREFQPQPLPTNRPE